MHAELLQRNLRALGRGERALARRLLATPRRARLVRGAEGEPLLLDGGRGLPLALGSSELEAVLAAAGGMRRALLCGVGDGELVARLLEREPELQLLAFERHPELLRLALETHDLSGALAAGRLGLALGADLARELERDSIGEPLLHPRLAEVYGHELVLIEEGMGGGPRALLALGGEAEEAVADALRRGGEEVWPIDLAAAADVEVACAFERIEAERALACVAGERALAECRARGLPLTLWETGALAPRLGAPYAGLRVLTPRPDRACALAARGFEVELAPRIAVWTAVPREAPRERALVFVGASLVDAARQARRRFAAELARLEGGGRPSEDAADRLLQAILDAQREDYSRPRTAALLQDLLGAWIAGAEGETLRECAGLVASAERRLAWVAALAPLGIEVHGDHGWRAAEGFGIRYAGTAATPAERAAILASSRIAVDVPHLHEGGAWSAALVEALAAGCCVLTEHGPLVAEAFAPGRDLVTYRDLDELRERAAHLLAHPDEAREIAARATRAARALADVPRKLGAVAEARRG